MAVSSMLSGTDAPADPERIQLEELIKQAGILAEGMKSSTVQSVGWYLMSVELQQACLRMRSLQATVAERSSRLSGLNVMRRIRPLRVQSADERPGLGRGGN